ncbi:unnamed protein product [Angiostrongylus costaricensis]|uniref:HABP4_PAI-RBP1 domain-containing protein n=1 Tax=Angiostrongylus costaricensis TaxID=334426 RepID=A0A0R3PB42_ANGCS|nr:unnamed protein product [Angiostrongylus costaricensis]
MKTEAKEKKKEKEKEKEKAKKEKGQASENFCHLYFLVLQIQSGTDRVGEKQQKAAFAVEKEKNQQTDRNAEKGKEAESKRITARQAPSSLQHWDENPNQFNVGKEGRQKKDINKLVEQLAKEEGKSGAASPKSL